MFSFSTQKELVDAVSNGLHEHGFESRVFERSCFDILAKNDKRLIALKLLHNIDSFTNEQALDLKNITIKMKASPMLVGCVGRNFTLKENYVYERFEIPAMNPHTFESTLENINPVFYSKKGKTTSQIFSDKMRQMRSSLKMSLEDLSRDIGVSKKTLFMGEKYSKISTEVVLKIEEYFSESITAPIDIFSWRTQAETTEREDAGDAERKAMDYFSKTGFDCIYLKTAPIKIINTFKDKLILSTILTGHKNDRSINDLKNMSLLSLNDKMVISLKGSEKNIDGVASIRMDELKSVDSCKELFELIYERESCDDC